MPFCENRNIKYWNNLANFKSSSSPTVNDDIDLGYNIGDFWLDTTNKKWFSCVDNTDGSADWQQLTNKDLNSSNITTGTLSVLYGGTGTSTQLTSGSIIFAGASGVYSQDNANLYYDVINHRLGLGTTSPGFLLHVNGNGVVGTTPTGTYYTIAPLNLCNSQQATLKTQLNLINEGGLAGAGAAIDFYTYTTVPTSTDPESRFGAIDNGDYSAYFTWLMKNPGSGANSLVERMRLTTSGSLGIGTSAPDRKVEINTGAATGGLRITYDDSNGGASKYADFLIDSNGDLSITAPYGKDISFGVGRLSTTGSITGNTLVSSVGIGTSPLTITSTTLVSNLNADLLDGNHASAFLTSVTAHNLLSTTHGDTLEGNVARGDIIIGNDTPKWSRLSKGSANQFLRSDGTDISWATPDHGSIGGLSDDDHTQYALLAGRSGGQTLIGGAGTTDDLILRATSGAGASGSDIIFQVGTDGGTEAMRILYNGYVGIGTNAPGYPLHIKSSISSSVLIEQTSNTANIFNLSLYNSGTSGDAGIIAFIGKDSVNNINVYGYIKNSIISNTDGSESGSFLFYTQNAGTRAERMRIAYDGKVGIGTNAPSHLLDISTTAATNGIRCNNTSVGSSGGGFLYGGAVDGTIMQSGERLGGILFQGSRDSTNIVNGGGLIAYADETWSNGSSYGTRLQFEQILTGSTSRTVTFKIDKNGYTGINTTAPDRQLEVNVGTTGEGIRITYNDNSGSASNYVDLLVNSNGYLTITPSGEKVYITNLYATSSKIIGSYPLYYAPSTGQVYCYTG